MKNIAMVLINDDGEHLSIFNKVELAEGYFKIISEEDSFLSIECSEDYSMEIYADINDIVKCFESGKLKIVKRGEDGAQEILDNLDGYYEMNFDRIDFHFKKGDMLNVAATKKEGLGFADLVVGVILVKYQEVIGDVVEE